ncbi:MAG TPA: HupE/UreJ family protein [Thermoanaerobaculia bacterium]|nr:HupE/UreJ family protein [Thermoanaerobaculia bacterium]
MRRRLALALALAAAMSGRASAHELGTVRVVARFEKGGRYEIDAIVDRQHLPPGFGAGVSPGGVENLTPELARSVGGVLAAATGGVRIAFDGRAVGPLAALVPPDGGLAAAAASPELTVRFSGTVPPGAKTFTWSNAVRLGSYMLTIRTDGQEQASRQWIEGAAESVPFPLGAGIAPMTRAEVVRGYLRLGYSHILPKGTDHILFVCGIFLLAVRLRPVLLQVSAFTLAHTLTLALTVYGFVALSPRIVEPLIALSIVYVAVENVLAPALTPWRVALVFAFGLLHGMGFAGVLSELGLPRSQFVPALLSFNAGVELGQLSVIALLALLLALPFRRKPWYRRRVVVPGSLAIAVVGLVWFVERVVG